jgi:hypothetical protein
MRLAFQKARDHPPFAPPELNLTAMGEDVGDRLASGLLDGIISVKKRQSELLRQSSADRRLASAHQTYERNCPLAERSVFRSQVLLRRRLCIAQAVAFDMFRLIILLASCRAGSISISRSPLRG